MIHSVNYCILVSKLLQTIANRTTSHSKSVKHRELNFHIFFFNIFDNKTFGCSELVQFNASAYTKKRRLFEFIQRTQIVRAELLNCLHLRTNYIVREITFLLLRSSSPFFFRPSFSISTQHHCIDDYFVKSQVENVFLFVKMKIRKTNNKQFNYGRVDGLI